eukprot:gb/GECG01006007.1/.p1 GENE.gb/GECG01006007.1/~~gb/GECG01006007.1/.p1  ORF type:complete len:538 (+),score=57.16 gb/GECG01006007.1/:1-1614(+)
MWLRTSFRETWSVHSTRQEIPYFVSSFLWSGIDIMLALRRAVVSSWRRHRSHGALSALHNYYTTVPRDKTLCSPHKWLMQSGYVRWAFQTRGAQSEFHASPSSAGKVIPFNLPDIGEGIAEVEIIQWFVGPGDQVEQFDKLLEVQSDKATVEITSRFDGTIKTVHYNAGDVAPTGKALLDIEVDDEDAPAESTSGAKEEGQGSKQEQQSPPSSEPTEQPSQDAGSAVHTKKDASGKVLATPAVRRIARENNVNLSKVHGTGKDGRVLKGDVIAYLEGAQPAVPKEEPRPEASSVGVPSGIPEDVTQPIHGIQRAMVKSMNQAWQVPHFGYDDEVRMDELMELRRYLKPIAEGRDLKMSYMPLMIKATSLALKQYPQLNAHVNSDCSELTIKGFHNIGVAIDSPRGLIVPNVKHCQERSVFEIAQELLRLQQLAQEGRLTEPDLNDGTFSLSNIGVIGGTYAAPVLMMPQVAIGAIGKVQRLPRFSNNGAGNDVVPEHLMKISWSADHRVVDGATMARFSNLWKQSLESPLTMLGDMK